MPFFARVKDAFLTALIAGLLALPLAGARTIDGINGLSVEWHLTEVGIAALLIFLGRLLMGLTADGHGKLIAPLGFITGIAAFYIPFPSHFLQSVTVIGTFVVALRAVITLLPKIKGRKMQQEPLPPCGEGSKNLDLHLQVLSFCRWGGKATDTALVATLSPPLTAPASGRGTLTAHAVLDLHIAFKKYSNLNNISLILILIAIVFPLTPLASRYTLDVAIMVATYIMLAWGLNITVGCAGLLDLGYAGFYALGAYSFALLAQSFGISFWMALPISGLIAAVAGFILGLPVLRLRGDYFAVVTLGFGEIVRLVLTNWTSLTNGPNGISGIPRPTFFGLDFARQASESHKTFDEFFGLTFDPTQRVIFLYYIILILALAVGWFSAKLRTLPLGRAWEAFRENEIACAALGINRWWIKLAAYSMGAAVAGLAGAFFATRQGFVSPESFTFTESATMLAIVILGGIGHPLGIALAAIFIIGLPELFREFEQYRMLAFGAGMVLIMIWRPGGLIATRTPTVRLQPQD